MVRSMRGGESWGWRRAKISDEGFFFQQSAIRTGELL
jgi:hypothetical protein